MKMDNNMIKALGLMLGSGVIMGVMFNIAITGNPLDTGGILGGLITGFLMYALS